MSSEESDNESLCSNDSDRELQIAFESGLLKSDGLNVAVQPIQEGVNDVEGLKAALKELHNGLSWIERMDVTSAPIPAPKPLQDQLGEDPDVLDKESVHDDFKREMRFYRQAQATAIDGIERLNSLGIPTKRPDDYFAEMAKSDFHMKKIREKLLSKQVAMDRSEKAKKLREMRKFGKQVQNEVIQKRIKEKSNMLQQVKKYRKGQQSKIDFLTDDNDGKKNQQKKVDKSRINEKRNFKNKKYGFGGQKKRSKSNTAKSTRTINFDASVNSGKKSGGASKKTSGGAKGQRLGKSKRMSNKNKKRK